VEWREDFDDGTIVHMGIKLSDELRQALETAADQPLSIEDEQSRRKYYLVDEESFLHLKGLQAEHNRECQERLRRLIDEGIESPGIPATEAFARLRTFAEGLSQSSS
jgi:hypothetical protein